MTSTAALTNAVRQLRPPAGDGPGDTDLLDRYARAGDQEAFAALVRRYGPLVLGVARRQLADAHRAEDVFQATFLALARSAAALGGRTVLANWLYTVALRQARKARGRAARRQALECAVPPHPRAGDDPLAEITAREFLRVVDDELARLPDRLRLPVLLCCVQGMTRDEAARRLGWSDGALKGRLERGRRRLAARLAARGLGPAAAFLAPLAAGAVPADLLARTADQAAAPWAKTIPAAVTALATAPRALVPAAVRAGAVLTLALTGWMVASGGANPVDPAPETPAAAPAPNPVPDDPLPAGATLRFGSPRYRHPTTIETLAVSVDGTVAVACSGTRFPGAVRAYDLATGRVRLTFDGAADVVAVAVSPDGRMLAATTVGTTTNPAVTLYDMTTGKEAARIPYPAANPGSTSDLLRFSPDGTAVVVKTADGNGLHLIGLAPGEVVRTIPTAGTVFAGAVSPDGKQVAAGGFDFRTGVWFARRWEVETGRDLGPLPVGKGGVRAVAYSPDGRTIAVGGESGRAVAVRLYDAATGAERLTVPYPDASLVRAVAFSPDGKTLAASGGPSTRLFDAATGKERVMIDRGAISLRFTPDGATLVGAVAGTVYRWDAATGRSLIPTGGDSPVAQVAATADGKRIVTRGQDGDGHVWDARTGDHLRRVEMNRYHGFALSPDGRFLVWPVPDEAVKFTLPGRPNVTYTGSRLRMIDVAAGTPVERFGGFEGDPHDLFFTPDGKTLVTVDRPAGQVRLWDVATGRVGRSLPVGEPDFQVVRARLSPDGTVLAVTAVKHGLGVVEPQIVAVWDLASGTKLDGRPGPWYDPEVMAIGPDGKAMAVATPGGTIRIQDPATGQVRGEIRGPHGRVTALAFGPDGRLFTGTPDATVLAWDPRVVKPPTGK